MPDLIDDYLAGPQLLRQAVAGMSPEQLLARPVRGKWSTLEVICHLADFEIVYADRIKRVIAEQHADVVWWRSRFVRRPLGLPPAECGRGTPACRNDPPAGVSHSSARWGPPISNAAESTPNQAR